MATPSRKKLFATLTTLAVLALCAGLLAGASAQTVRFGNFVATIDGDFAPKKLPRRKAAPISLRLGGTLGTADGSHVQPLRTLKLEFDKRGHLNTKGLASCTVGKLASTLTAQAKRACGRALVGTGRATAEVAFPEQAPFLAGGPMLIFNGSKGRKQMLLIHVYARVPAPTTFVTTAKIGRGKGPYGTSAFIRVPTITSGQGSLTSFKAKLRKVWTYRGHRQSLLLASCPSGSLRARGEFDFGGGARFTGQFAKSCKPKG